MVLVVANAIFSANAAEQENLLPKIAMEAATTVPKRGRPGGLMFVLCVNGLPPQYGTNCAYRQRTVPNLGDTRRCDDRRLAG